MSQLIDIQEKLLDTQAALAHHERALALSPDSRALYHVGRSLKRRNRELEEEFVLAAQDIGIDICSYRLFKDGGRPTIAGVAGALGSFQHMLSVLYDAVKNGRPKQRQRLSPDIVLETALEFGYSYPGSLGVVLTIPNERMLAGIESNLDVAINAALDIAKTTDQQRLIDLSRQFGIAAIRATYAWADQHVQHGIGAAIDWRRGRDIRSEWLFQSEELAELQQAISRISEEETVTFEVTGLLLGADNQPRKFHFQPDSGGEMRGTAEEAAINPANHPTLFRRYLAKITKSTVVQYSTEEESERFHLVSLQKIGVTPHLSVDIGTGAKDEEKKENHTREA